MFYLSYVTNGSGELRGWGGILLLILKSKARSFGNISNKDQEFALQMFEKGNVWKNGSRGHPVSDQMSLDMTFQLQDS